MTTLYVTEYSNALAAPGTNGAAFPAEPAVAEQTVAIGGTSAASNAFQNSTRFVRLHADTICSVEFGASPTATAAKARLAAGIDRMVAVPQGQSFKVAVITNT